MLNYQEKGKFSIKTTMNQYSKGTITVFPSTPFPGNRSPPGCSKGIRIIYTILPSAAPVRVQVPHTIPVDANFGLIFTYTYKFGFLSLDVSTTRCSRII